MEKVLPARTIAERGLRIYQKKFEAAARDNSSGPKASMESSDDWLDSRGRPFLRLPLPGLDDPLEVKVDTGFNGALWIGRGDAGQITLQLTPGTFAYTLAGGSVKT